MHDLSQRPWTGSWFPAFDTHPEMEPPRPLACSLTGPTLRAMSLGVMPLPSKKIRRTPIFSACHSR